MNRVKLGQKIQAAREEKKMSQEQLANAIGCSQSALSNYEKGKRRIYLTQLEKLSETLDKPISYFVENDEDNLEMSPNLLNKNSILRIINHLYSLSDSEINEVDKYIQYLKWRNSKNH